MSNKKQKKTDKKKEAKKGKHRKLSPLNLVRTAIRPDLTFDLVKGIFVQNTPAPKPNPKDDEPLKDFGVTDVNAPVHAGRVQGALNAIGWQIRRTEVETGAAVTVANCTASVLDHAL